MSMRLLPEPEPAPAPPAPTWDAARLARAALTAVCESGGAEVGHLVARMGPEEVWDTVRTSDRESAWTRRARALHLGRLEEDAVAAGVRLMVPSDPDWPPQLAGLNGVTLAGMGGVPLGLWVKGPGDLKSLTAASVDIVGSRAATAYGYQAARDLAYEVARPSRHDPGWTIVSGGAYGIDAAAHGGAMAADGATIAVLAGGADVIYPKGNHTLLTQIAERWLIVSEQPPGRNPTRHGFLSRNRLIAALTQGTIIVEAALRSGARNTANWASGCGRLLMAVPGPITSALSETPHRLIRDGEAVLVGSATDVRSLLLPMGEAPVEDLLGPRRRHDAVPPELRPVLEALPGRGSASAAELAATSGVSMMACLASLGALAELGWVEQTDAGAWRLAVR